MCCKRRWAAATSLWTRRSARWRIGRGDIFLLCTDGLVEGLYDHQLVELLRPSESAAAPADPAHRLVQESLARDGRDNTTALVIQVI